MLASSLPPELAASLTPEERVEALFREGEVRASERVFLDAEECDTYMAELVTGGKAAIPA